MPAPRDDSPGPDEMGSESDSSNDVIVSMALLDAKNAEIKELKDYVQKTQKEKKELKSKLNKERKMYKKLKLRFKV